MRVQNPNLTVEQDRFVRLEANGYNYPEIILELWGLRKEDDPKTYHAMESRLTRWRRHPKYEEVWKDEIRRQAFPIMSKAVRKLKQQVNSDTDWLANKAANDIVAFAGKRIFGNEDNTVNVQVTGMPDIGSPEQPE